MKIIRKTGRWMQPNWLGTANRLRPTDVHAMVSALGAEAGCTSGTVGDAAGVVGLLVVVSVAVVLLAAAAAAAAACALATIAANDGLPGVARSVGSRAAAVDGTTGSWNTLATRIYHTSNISQ